MRWASAIWSEVISRATIFRNFSVFLSAAYGLLSPDDDGRAASARFLNKTEESRGVFRMQPDAAVRDRHPQPFDFRGSVDGIAA